MDIDEEVERRRTFAIISHEKDSHAHELEARIARMTEEMRAQRRDFQDQAMLLKDEREGVRLRLPRDASVLYLSVVDYPTGWGHGAPSATFLPDLRDRWDDVTAMELSDRTTPGELALVRSSLDAYDAVVASVFVRTASYSGRMDLEPRLQNLLRTVARRTEARDVPFVTVFFGNPYAATFLTELPAALLTYDFYALAEYSAVRAITGQAPITGRLPIELGEYPIGHGLTRDVQ